MVQTEESISYSKSLSLVSISYNSLGNSYNFLCNFYFAYNLYYDPIYFILPGSLFFICFSVFDIKLLLNLWKIKYLPSFNDNETIKLNLFRFYLLICKLTLFLFRFMHYFSSCIFNTILFLQLLNHYSNYCDVDSANYL